MLPRKTCQRCDGMVVSERDDRWTYWKCVNCGRRYDQQSEENRYVHSQLKGIATTDDIPGPSDYEPASGDVEPG